jgi:hypothetical protein
MTNRRKLGGRFTEPNLPQRYIVHDSGVTVENRYRGGDHGPPHLHVVGRGRSTKIGQNGRPLRNNPPLSAAQQAVVTANRRAIRKATGRIGRWHWFESLP